MTQRERTAWALYASEGWRSVWDSREIFTRIFGKRYALYAKTRSIVVFDRAITGRFDPYLENK